MFLEISPHVWIIKPGTPTFGKAKRQPHNDQFAARGSVEDAAAVAKTTIGGTENAGRAGRNVHHPRRLHDVAHLLAVGADVLYQRRPRLPGNVGEVFNSPPVALHGVLDHVIPCFAGVHFQGHRLGVFMQDGDAAASRMHHYAVKARVTH